MGTGVNDQVGRWELRGMRFSHDYAKFFDVHTADRAQVEQAREDFHPHLIQLLTRLNVPADTARDITDQLWREMTGPTRHYHTPVHVLGMLACAQRMGVDLSDSEQLAIWFHDAIYEINTPPGENEERSARWMEQVLGETGVDHDVLTAAGNAIRCTARHLDDQVPAEHRTIMDLDLWGLAADPVTFSRQSTAVRSEMPAVSDEQYSRNTIGFFRRLLARPRLYRTDRFACLEPIARRQLNAEIDRLSIHIPGNGQRHASAG